MQSGPRRIRESGGDRGRARFATAAARSVKNVAAASLLALAIAPPPAAFARQIIELPHGIVSGGYVEDNGNALLVIQPPRTEPPSDGDSVVMQLSRGGHRETKRIPKLHASLYKRLSEGRLLLAGVRGPYSRGGYGRLVYQIIRVSEGDMVDVLWEWEGDGGGQWREGGLEFSNDGRIWGHVTTLRVGRKVRGRTFRFGSPPSTEFHYETRIAFPEIDRYQADVNNPPFLILDSDGPLVLAPYHNGAYLVRIDGAAALEFRYLANERESEGWRDNVATQLYFHWQPRERILWGRGSSTPWYAYDLSDVDLSVEKPVRAFLTLALEGWPHPTRGFVTPGRGDGRYRLLHLWFEPKDGRREVESSDLRSRAAATEVHRSEWIPGLPPGAGPHAQASSSFVSPNGQHAIVIEEDPSEPARSYARRLQLTSGEDSDP